jgi:hypothetical protein
MQSVNSVINCHQSVISLSESELIAQLAYSAYMNMYICTYAYVYIYIYIYMQIAELCQHMHVTQHAAGSAYSADWYD